MYKEVLEGAGVTQTPEFTLSILTYEVGKLHQLMVYIERFGKAGHIGDEETEIGDVLTMACLYAEQKGYNPEHLLDTGLERFKFRIDEVKKAEMEGKYGD